MQTELTLYLPDLIPSKSASALIPPQSFPSLSKLLSKASILPQNEALRFYFQGFSPREIPTGAITALAHGIIDNRDQRTWCRADPVTCQLDHKSAFILGNAHLALSDDEVADIHQTLQPLFHERGGDFYTVNATEWLCTLPSNNNIVTNDLNDVLGKDMGFLMPTGPDEVFWHKLITECQMALANTHTNRQREKNNLPVANSLWFWGIGTLPPLQSKFDHILTDDSIIKGLALQSNVPVLPLPSEFNFSLLKDKNTFVSDLRLALLYKNGLYDQYIQHLQLLEEKWFTPLLSFFEKGQLDAITIDTNNEKFFKLLPHNRFYFWRKNKAFNEFLP